ncbi:MAG TPA: PAS domain S-box protein, partial [Thermoanaerobaculia bacterium]|nr:PAS domain S-box protein [Thermoanaerobaculia bacterium]
MAERQRRSPTSYAASRIAIVYALGAALWVVLTDGVLQLLPFEARTASRVATFKGVGFAIFTACLLYAVLRRRSVIADAELADLDRIGEAHSALAESETRLSLIIGAAAEAIAICDENGVVRTWNQEAQRTFGRSEEDAIGEELASLIV